MDPRKQEPGSVIQDRNRNKNTPGGKVRKGRKNAHSSNPQHKRSAP